ncbi:hypothetical protein EXS72_02785 [Candidatus Pacearchaeota archaeon]|nr:hypothetical protein [Candidatus Pacearchaeota archaeon]
MKEHQGNLPFEDRHYSFVKIIILSHGCERKSSDDLAQLFLDNWLFSKNNLEIPGTYRDSFESICALSEDVRLFVCGNSLIIEQRNLEENSLEMYCTPKGVDSHFILDDIEKIYRELNYDITKL